MGILIKLALLFLFIVRCLRATSFKTICESYPELSVFIDGFCYMKEKQPSCGIFPGGETVGQTTEEIWHQLAEALAGEKEENTNNDYYPANIFGNDDTRMELRGPFEPGQPIEIFGKVDINISNYNPIGFRFESSTGGGYFQMQMQFNQDDSNSVGVNVNYQHIQHTNILNFGPQDVVHFKFEIDDNDRMQIIANGELLLQNLTRPDNITMIDVWGAFDLSSVHIGERFYGPYKDCPRIALELDQVASQWVWTDTNEPFDPSRNMGWDANQPDNQAGEETCGCFNLTTEAMRDIFCEPRAERICRYPPISPQDAYNNCLNGQGLNEPLLLGNGERCLQVTMETNNWTQAMDHCNVLGGHLFHIYSLQDYMQIVEWFKKLRGQGLTLNAHAGYKKLEGWTETDPHSKVAWMISSDTGYELQLADVPGGDFIMPDYNNLRPDNKYGFFGTCGQNEWPFHNNHCEDPKEPQGYYMNEYWYIYHHGVAVCQYRPYSSNKSFDGMRDMRSKGKSYGILAGATDATECAHKCATEPYCQGFNTIESATGVDCEFMSEVGHQKYSSGIIYYEKQTTLA